jgi:hypothetical protein
MPGLLVLKYSAQVYDPHIAILSLTYYVKCHAPAVVLSFTSSIPTGLETARFLAVRPANTGTRWTDSRSCFSRCLPFQLREDSASCS